MLDGDGQAKASKGTWVGMGGLRDSWDIDKGRESSELGGWRSSSELREERWKQMRREMS